LGHTVAMTDHYADGTYRWWHLSEPSPELVAALGDGWLGPSGRALDVGCGLGVEAGYLAGAGWQVAGVDLSQVALAQAAGGGDGAMFMRADVRQLPFHQSCFDAALDRGCFHYLDPRDRPRYADELRRVLRPGAGLLLRASLYAAGVRNDIDETAIGHTFAAWQVEHMQRAAVPSDTRTLEVILARLRSG
jgi:SAM-dependent methyltransferase